MRTPIIYIILIFFCSCNFEKAKQHKIETADEAIAELKEGNIRFLKNESTHSLNYKTQIEETKNEQHPHSLILGCIDSRVPPEIIFDQKLGQIFVARVAGNIDDDYIIGSMEFAVNVKHTKLIVVLGHNHCGAVIGAIENVELEHLTGLAKQIKPAISDHKSYPMDDAIADATSKKNIQITIQHLLARSKILNESVLKNEIKIVGAFYNIKNGEVEFL